MNRTTVTAPRRSRAVVSAALTTSETLLRLTNAAQIPLCGGAFGLAREIISMIEEIESSGKMVAELMSIIDSYGQRVADLAEAMSPGYVQTSIDTQAIIARRAIAKFELKLRDTRDAIQRSLKTSTLMKIIYGTAIRNHLQACCRQLAAASQDFNQETLHIIVAYLSHPHIQPNSVDLIDLRITGAKPMAPHSIQLRHDEPVLAPGDLHYGSFLNNVLRADVATDVRLVKMYYQRSGGEKALLADLEKLSRNSYPCLPIVEGYCLKASVPFIVLASSSVRPLIPHLKDMVVYNPGAAVVLTWKLVTATWRAVEFLITNNPESGIESSLPRAPQELLVDGNGRLLVVPINRPHQESSALSGKFTIPGVRRLISFVWYCCLVQHQLRLLSGLGHAVLGGIPFKDDVIPDVIPGDAMDDFLYTGWGSRSVGKGWWVCWPRRCVNERNLSLGDLGVFQQDNCGLVFEKLGSSSAPVAFYSMPWATNPLQVQKCGNRTIRVTLKPNVLPRDACCAVRWISQLQDPKDVHARLQKGAFIVSNTPRGGNSTVMVCATLNMVRFKRHALRNLSARLATSIYFFIHLYDNHMYSHSYWSFDATPRPNKVDGVVRADPGIIALDCPTVSRARSKPLRYVY